MTVNIAAASSEERTVSIRPSADIELLNVLKNKENFERFRPYLKEYACTGFTMDILKDIPDYFKFCGQTTGDLEWEKFSTWFRVVRHSTWRKDKHDAFQMVFDNLIAASVLPPNPAIVNHFIRLDYATRIADKCRQIAEGRLDDLTTIQDDLDEFAKVCGKPLYATDEWFASSDVKRLLDDMLRRAGIEWRLEDMNVAIGPLHKGDLVLVAARPEVGKTSFLCSEFTHMVSQLPEGQEAIIFNNEERNKLMIRLLMAGADMNLVEIGLDEDKAIARYEARIKGAVTRIKIVEPADGFSTKDVERILSRGNYGLIGINVMDKVLGFENQDQDVGRQRELAKWARGIASKYGPTFAVYQADGSADGQRWLTMAQIYGSKTGVQGEADALLMIGADPTIEDRRFISVAKNKLPGGKRTQPKRRHGKFEVEFDQATGVYRTLEFK